jgi:hypothetical protein
MRSRFSRRTSNPLPVLLYFRYHALQAKRTILQYSSDVAASRQILTHNPTYSITSQFTDIAPGVIECEVLLQTLKFTLFAVVKA